MIAPPFCKENTMHKRIMALGLVALMSAQPALAQAGEEEGPDISFTTGIDFSSGDYGTGVDTDILLVPFNARVSTGNLRFNASIPFIRIEGAGDIVGGDGGPVVVNPASPVTTRSGIGDLTVGANYAIPEDRFGLGLDFGARVKLPTAETGLGTGETDVSFTGEISRTFAMVTPFAQVGYRVMGDPDGFDLDNTWFGSVGLSAGVGKSVVLASYDYRQSPSPLVDDSQELFGAFSTPLSRRLNLTFYGSAGLSEGAPGYGVGAIISLNPF